MVYTFFVNKPENVIKKMQLYRKNVHSALKSKYDHYSLL